MPNSESTSDWREFYRAAAAETDPQKLASLVQILESALTNRLRELAGQQGHESELQEIKATSQKLLIIKTEKLGWPKINLDRK